MGTKAVNTMEAKDTSETVPIYVKVFLLIFEICANICKSIWNDNDKTVGTGAANNMQVITTTYDGLKTSFGYEI